MPYLYPFDNGWPSLRWLFDQNSFAIFIINYFFKNRENKLNRKKTKAKYLTSKKLTKIYFDENINNKNNQLEHNQKYICIDKPKKYILKSDKNLGN